MQSIWDSEEVPEDWWKQLVIPLHKKGAYNDCDNLRGIALQGDPRQIERKGQSDAQGEPVWFLEGQG